jgi:O-antigen ligase
MNIGSISIPKIIALGLVFISLFRIGQSFSISTLKRFLIPVFLFSLSLFISYLINYEGYDISFRLLFMIIQNIVFFWIVANILKNNPEAGYKVLLSLNLAIFVSALLFMLGIGVEITEGRLTIFSENANRLGMFSIFSILFIISNVFENKQHLGSSRYLLLTLTIPLANMAAQTGSRSTYIGLLLTIALYFVLKSKSKFSLKIVYFFLGGVALFALNSYLMTFDVLSERMNSFYSEGNLSGRDVIWQFVMTRIMEKPIFGVGINGYTNIISELYGSFFSPHNVFLEIFAYSGLLGLLIFLYFIFQMVREGYYINKYDNYLMPLLYLVLILFVFLSGQALNLKAFWIIYAYLVTCRSNITKSAY